MQHSTLTFLFFTAFKSQVSQHFANVSCRRVENEKTFKKFVLCENFYDHQVKKKFTPKKFKKSKSETQQKEKLKLLIKTKIKKVKYF